MKIPDQDTKLICLYPYHFLIRYPVIEGIENIDFKEFYLLHTHYTEIIKQHFYNLKYDTQYKFMTNILNFKPIK